MTTSDEPKTPGPPAPPGPPGPPARGGRRRALLAAVAALVALVPIAIGIALTSSGAPRPLPGTTTAPLHLEVASPTTIPARPRLLLPPGHGVLVATVVRGTVLRSRPGGRRLARLATRTAWGSPQVLWVRRRSGRWLGVVSPQVGNNRLGWIPATSVSLARTAWELRVSIAARRLTVLKRGRVVRRYTIAVGAPQDPTPTGDFDVTDRLVTGDNSGPYGCCILALSAVAPHAIPDWTGGNRIAIHSTPETWTIGAAVSHGCMRLTLAEGRWLIDHVPLGTPAVISSA